MGNEESQVGGAKEGEEATAAEAPSHDDYSDLAKERSKEGKEKEKDVDLSKLTKEQREKIGITFLLANIIYSAWFWRQVCVKMARRSAPLKGSTAFLSSLSRRAGLCFPHYITISIILILF